MPASCAQNAETPHPSFSFSPWNTASDKHSLKLTAVELKSHQLSSVLDSHDRKYLDILGNYPAVY